MLKTNNKYGQAGTSALMLAIAVLAIALIIVFIFAIWANNGRQDYKNNSDKKASAAVTAAIKVEDAKLQNQFDEQAKQPVQTYSGPATYGSVKFNYPKSWDGVVDTSDASNPIKAFFFNGLVPGPLPAPGVFYALRVDLVNDDYSNVVDQFNNQIKKGLVTATPYVPPQMAGQPNVQTGMRLDGLIEENVNGSMVVVKVRDKTLKIYTESPTFLSDFNKYILASLTYVP